jgi:hypothetical protein
MHKSIRRIHKRNTINITWLHQKVANRRMDNSIVGMVKACAGHINECGLGEATG